MKMIVRDPWLYRCSESNRYPGMINKQAHRGLQVTCSRPREQMQPKSKGHSRSVSARTEGAVKLWAPALTSPSQWPTTPAWEDPVTRRTAPEAERSGARKGLQEAIPKEPPGHVRDTHLFILSRPGRAAVPLQVRNRSSGTANPPTLRSPVCRGRGGAFPSWWAAIAGGRGGSCGKCWRSGQDLLAATRSD